MSKEQLIENVRALARQDEEIQEQMNSLEDELMDKYGVEIDPYSEAPPPSAARAKNAPAHIEVAPVWKPIFSTLLVIGLGYLIFQPWS